MFYLSTFRKFATKSTNHIMRKKIALVVLLIMAGVVTGLAQKQQVRHDG